MDHQYISTTKTRFNPCVIEYLVKQSRFVVGTYELVEKDSELAKKYSDLEARNYRLGTLELFDSATGEIVLEYECQFGGVFDLRRVELPSLPTEIDLFVVAHANGVLALYQIVFDEFTLLSHWKTSSDMLTTVQDCINSQRISFISGGATGVLSQIHCHLPAKLPVPDCTDLSQLKLFSDHELIEDSITDSQHPIWFIRTHQVQSTDQFNCDNLLFVGSEDSKWRVISERSNNILYTNSDAMAGITSFEFLKTVPNLSQTEPDSTALIVFVGSYDEFLRIYQLSYSWTPDQDASTIQQPSIDSTTVLYKIHIEGGGIWRMKSFQHDSELIILVSAMYSGAYLLSFESDEVMTNSVKCRTKCKSSQQLILPPANTDKDGDDQGKLIYGINSTADLSTVLFASFYEKELYLFCHRVSELNSRPRSSG